MELKASLIVAVAASIHSRRNPFNGIESRTRWLKKHKEIRFYLRIHSMELKELHQIDSDNKAIRIHSMELKDVPC